MAKLWQAPLFWVLLSLTCLGFMVRIGVEFGLGLLVLLMFGVGLDWSQQGSAGLGCAGLGCAGLTSAGLGGAG